MNFEDSWEDLYYRLKNAENELEELADATNDPSEASRLLSKMHGVSLARDYMRGYFDPTSVEAATPGRPDTTPSTLSVFKYEIDPFSETTMIKGAKPLYVGEQGTDVCVWALVDTTVEETEYRAINAYGTGHSVPANPGRFIGSVQMRNGENAGLVFHIFDGDDV